MKYFRFIRHASTAGNLERRYIGRTDEPLCEAGILSARTAFETGLPAFDTVYTSPYLRCVQTANILFPKYAPVIVNELRECDFGLFENRNADELENDTAYAQWLATGCTTKIPGGEDVMEFKERCCFAFLQIAETAQADSHTAIVTHGGCIMAILERFARPKREFYEWHISNCGFVDCAFDGVLLTLTGGSLC